MTPAEMKDFVTRFLEDVWNRGDVAAVDRYVADAYTIRHDPHDPWHGKTLDRGEFRQRLETARAPFPDQRFDVIESAAENERVVIAWRWKGTHLAEIPGFPASGRAICMTGVTFYFLADGRLTGHWQEVDRLGVFQQLAAKA